jgi:hypothetical protein
MKLLERNDLPFGPSTALHQRPNTYISIQPLMRLVYEPKSFVISVQFI